MNKWISVEERLPEEATMGVHDVYPVLVLTNAPTSKVTEWYIKTCTWVNNSFQGYPAGATKVTHWMYLPELP